MKEQTEKGRASRVLRRLAGGRGPSPDSLVHEWSVLPTVAVSCYWIWLYIAYSLDVFVVSSDAFVRFDILQKGFGFLGAALFMIVVSRLRTATFFERTPFLALFSVGAGLSIVVVSALARAGVPLVPPVVFAAWLLMGAGTAAAFLRLFSGLQDAGQGRFCAINSLALFLSGFFYLLLLGLQDNVRLVLTVFVVCFTAFVPLSTPASSASAGDEAGTAASARKVGGKSAPVASATGEGAPSQTAGNAAVKALLSFRGELFLLSVVFGLAYCLGISLSIMSGSLEFIWLSLCVPGIFLMLYSVFLKNRVSVRVLLTFLFPIAAFLLLLLPFSNPFGLVLCCSLLVMCFTTYDVLNVVRLRSIIAANRLPQAKSWATGRYPQLAGLVLGWAVGYGMLLTDDALKALLPVVCVGLVVAIVAMLTRYVWKFSDAGGTAHVSEETVESVHDAITLRYRLSPREREVMELLVRGYSTERIGKDLHISYHTVKTHVYHIYQKVGVHAQQELIDLVEERLRLMR